MSKVRSGELKHYETEVASEPIKKKNLRVRLLLSDDLIAEILSWLPPKCAGRCKIVCKSWRAIIQSRHFIEQHMQRQDYMVYSRLPLLPSDHQPFEGVFYLRGLFLEQNTHKWGTYRIINYATNEVFDLPELNERQIMASMCHLPTSDEYKVLNLHWKENDTDIGLKVFTKGTDVTWRCVEIPSLLSCSKNNDENAFLRTIGSVGYIIKYSKYGWKMMAFQIEDESFVEISLPWSMNFCDTGSRFFPMIWDSDISIGHFVGEALHIWVLQDYKISKWDERKIVFPSPLLKRRPSIVSLVPHCVFDGEILILGVHVLQSEIMTEMSYNIKTKALSPAMMTPAIRPSLVSL